MVVRCVPKIYPGNVMQIIKSISAREFFYRYPEIKKRNFWGGKLWTQSYFVETIGNANEDMIRSYVRGQLTSTIRKKKGRDSSNCFKTRLACDQVLNQFDSPRVTLYNFSSIYFSFSKMLQLLLE